MILLGMQILFLIWGINAIRTRKYRIDGKTFTGKAARTAGILQAIMIPTVIVVCFTTGFIAGLFGEVVTTPEWTWIFSAIEWTIVIALFVGARKVARRGQLAEPEATLQQA
jgi:hypothetical protein